MRKTKLFSLANPQAAFTLLEVLIAIAIVSIVATGAYLAFGDSRSGDLKNHAYKLLGQMQIAQEESIIRGVELGLRVDDDGYFFMVYNDEKWQPLEDHQILKEQKFEEPFRLYVHLEGQEALLKNAEDEEEKDSNESDSSNSEIEASQKKRLKTPQIFMLSSGEMNEFLLTIGLDNDDEKFYRILGNYLGRLQISSVPIEGHYESDWDKDFDEDWDKLD
ncbi:type II secretion system minor pseudopilin GspH [Kangiella sp. TOML190]|uniref:type II secretion system minor pseudopilin GspH n=1 Tax=Kangiella sp. TOML190 TaxID=2931351 RepID=UPI002041D644|nr:type II secretion system minor pseudopilin GspH [Kangiella sp. TOML190]